MNAVQLKSLGQYRYEIKFSPELVDKTNNYITIHCVEHTNGNVDQT